MTDIDVAIVGAGPSGIAAATEARSAGMSVIVIDEQPAPGGQIWRGLESADNRRKAILGSEYAAGTEAMQSFRKSGAEYLPGSLAWNIDRDLSLDISGAGGGRRLRASSIVIATGAIERAMPIPGWTLPGTMSAGALQILLKTAGLVHGSAVLAGNGPLLWLLASQMVAAGAAPRAVVEVVTPGRYLTAAVHFSGAFRGWRDLGKGMSMMREVRDAGVPVYRNAGDLRIEGSDRTEGLSFTSGKRRQTIGTKCVALHHGVIPNQQMSRLIGCRQNWNKAQACFVPVTDDYGETSVPGVYIAGDGSGIGGAGAAILSGRIAAVRVAQKLGWTPDSDAVELQAALRRSLAIRPFLDSLFQPLAQALDPEDSTIICRCEEVTAGDIRRACDLGAAGPNQLKSFLRCGMGPCQGRVCGPVVTQLMASRRGRPPEEIGYFGIRPPLKPLRLADVAAVQRHEPTNEKETYT